MVEWGEYKNIAATTYQCKDPKKHYNHFNFDDRKKEKCWKLHRELNLNNIKKDNNKKNLISTNLSNKFERTLDVDEKIVCT